MEQWVLLIISLSLCLVLNLLLLTFLSIRKHNDHRRLPPGPFSVPLLGNLLWLRNRFSLLYIETLLRSLRSHYGPIIRLQIGSRSSIFIADRSIAHAALIENSAVFADRPPPAILMRQRNIAGSPYGPIWRLLRRNLTAEILHPSRMKLFGHARRWVLDILLSRLRGDAAESNDGGVVVIKSFQFAMFCLLVLMCFGEKLDEKAIREIEVAQRDLLLFASKLNVFAFVPSITRILFRQRWIKALEYRNKRKALYVPLIQARREHKLKQKRSSSGEERFVYSYVDSLLDVELPEEGRRKLNDDEIVSLCSEFLTAGTDTTSTALQWIMANLVKDHNIQNKLVEEIYGVVERERDGEVNEEELQGMQYLKAVILEGLRRHPPAHFVLPHAVIEDTILEEYVIPKHATVNFMVTEMNWDERVWKDPMEFRPERFLPGGEGEALDITGSREIKMMPFGAGRRICPGLNLAMLHLEYFVANLVAQFEWKTVDGEEVDLTEKPEFTVAMQKSLKAKISPRRRAATAEW